MHAGTHLQCPNKIRRIIPRPDKCPIQVHLLHSMSLIRAPLDHLTFINNLHIQSGHHLSKTLARSISHFTGRHPKGSHCLILPHVRQKRRITKRAIPNFELFQFLTPVQHVEHSFIAISSEGNREHFQLLSIHSNIEEKLVCEKTWYW